MFCQERSPEPWHVPSETERALRALVLRLDSVQAMRTQELNRLQVAKPSVQDGIAQHIEWLDAEIARLAKSIQKQLGDDDDLNGKRAACSTAFRALENEPSPSCWRFLLRQTI